MKNEEWGRQLHSAFFILNSSFLIGGTTLRLEPEPVEPVGAKAQKVGSRRDPRKDSPPDQLHGNAPTVGAEVQLDGLNKAREVGDAQNHLSRVLADEGQNAGVARVEKIYAASSEDGVALPDRDQAARPVEERGRHS